MFSIEDARRIAPEMSDISDEDLNGILKTMYVVAETCYVIRGRFAHEGADSESTNIDDE